MNCPVKAQCSKAKYGKGIQRSEYQHYINRNKKRIEQRLLPEAAGHSRAPVWDDQGTLYKHPYQKVQTKGRTRCWVDVCGLQSQKNNQHYGKRCLQQVSESTCLYFFINNSSIQSYFKPF